MIKLTSLGLYRINSDYQVTLHRDGKGTAGLHTDVYKLAFSFTEAAMRDPDVSRIEFDRSVTGNSLTVILTRTGETFEVMSEEDEEETNGAN